MPSSSSRGRVPHAARRAKSRYGLAVDAFTLRDWARRIEAGDAKYIRIHFRERREFEIIHEGIPIRVIYDAALRHIVTARPRSGRTI